MPLSLWGLDEARKNFNERVDKTGSAAWSAARGRKPKDEDEPQRPDAIRRTSTTSSSPSHFPPPPARRVSTQDLPRPPRSPSTRDYEEAKSRKPPPPPSLPVKQNLAAPPSTTPPLPRRSTSSIVSSGDEDSIIRPSELLNRAPTFPATIQRNQSQDGVTNELAEKLAKMRTRSTSPATSRSSSETTTTTRPPLPKPVALKPTTTTTPAPPPTNLQSKPSLPPRTTPAPPRIPPLKPTQSARPPPSLPYAVSHLHKRVLPQFQFPPVDPTCKSPGLDLFNRLFPQPLWELEQASLFILTTLYPVDDAYAFKPKQLEGPISLIMRDMDGNAHAENSTVIVSSGGKKQFRWRSNLVFSTRNLTSIGSRGNGDTWFIEEVRGVIVHELTHSWQWSCRDTPGGLIEGIFFLNSC